MSDAVAGLWGQLDLAGDLWEWNLDTWYGYSSSCTDCVTLGTGSDGLIGGGAFDNGTSGLLPPTREAAPAAVRSYTEGVRCSRAP
jgi:formylglycine-generating enzyme required for sulfatase activity